MDVADRRPEAAIKRYEELLAADPGNVQASLSLIQLLARQGLSKTELLSKADAAIARHPELAGPRLARISLLLEQGEIKPALTAAQEGAVAHANEPAFQDMIGIAQLALGDANQAAAAFNRMALLQPGSPQPWMRLAEVSIRQKDANAAVRHFQKALQIKSDYLPAQTNLVGVLLGSGRAREAMELARTVQKQRPGEPVGWVIEGDIARQTLQLPESVRAYEQALMRAESEEVVVRLHTAYVDAQRRAEAAKLEATWLAKMPNSPMFLFRLGEQALQRADYTVAQANFEKVLALQPQNALAMNNLAWLLNKAGKPEALPMAEKALALAPDRAEILDTAAEIHAGKKQWAKAIELQKRALAQQPEQSIYRLHLSQYLVAAGEKSQAREQLDILLARGQSMPQFAEAKRMRDAL
jgi:putative PEP-CTERM system TPR-repeat lipoprotein